MVPIDLGPLGGFLARNPDIVDRMLMGIDEATVDALFSLISDPVPLSDSEEEQWSEVAKRYEESRAEEVIKAAIDALGERIVEIRDLVSQPHSEQGAVIPTDVPIGRVKKLGALAVLLGGIATGLYSIVSLNVRLEEISSFLMGIPGVWLWYQSYE